MIYAARITSDWLDKTLIDKVNNTCMVGKVLGCYDHGLLVTFGQEEEEIALSIQTHPKVAGTVLDLTTADLRRRARRCFITLREYIRQPFEHQKLARHLQIIGPLRPRLTPAVVHCSEISCDIQHLKVTWIARVVPWFPAC